MLQAHSLLWHYLWAGPNVLLVALAFLLLRRHLHKKYPVFFFFAIAEAVVQLTIYVADITPAIDAATFWRIFWAGLLVEGTLKFVLIGEIFAQAFSPYASIAKLAKFLIRGVGVALVLSAAILAAYAPHDSRFGVVSGAHLLRQTIYLTESGLLLFVFVFSAYFHLRLDRPVFGIALGLVVSSCMHLATSAMAANGGLPEARRILTDFVNMATYHLSVLIWLYYLLIRSAEVVVEPPAALPESNLDVWNRELERLAHR